MIVVVGGQSRNVGKTRVVCEIIQATPHLAWTAIKLTPHDHARPEDSNTDTGRYRAAGAHDALLLTIRSGQIRAALARLPARNVIIESTGAMGFLQPDLFVFVQNSAEADWKESAMRYRDRADVVLETNDPATAAIVAVRTLVEKPGEA